MGGSIFKLLACAAVLLFGAAKAEAEWLRAESRNFIVYSESSERRLREQVEQLEEFDGLLRLLTGTNDSPSPNRLTIYFVRGNRELSMVVPAGSNLAGFYTATPHSIFAVVDESTNRGVNNNDVLFHEYAHHFMMQYRPAAYPVWYSEGFAEYVATARIEPDRIEVGRFNPNRAVWAANSRGWIPYDEVLFGRPNRFDASAGVRFYAQSWLLVHYLLRDAERRRALTNYLSAVLRGDDPRAAFTAIFNMDKNALEQALQEYRRTMSYTRFRRDPPQAPIDVRITPMPPSADDLLLLQAAMNRGLDAARQDEVLAQIRTRAARHGDAFARRVLAQAEVMYGDPAAGERLLEPLLAEAPNDVSLLFLRGLRHLNAGRKYPEQREEQFRLARRWLARAHRADGNHYPTLLSYAESYSTEPGFVSQNTENILLLANQLAPQVHAVRLAAASMLMMRDKFAEAEVLLLPLASSPHENESVQSAREMIAAARERRRPGSRAPAPASAPMPAR